MKPVVLLELALNNLLLALFAGAAMLGDIAFFGIGAWSFALGAAYVGSLWVIAKSLGRRPWVVADENGRGAPKPGSVHKHDSKEQRENHSMSTLLPKMVVAAVLILIAGFLLSHTGEAIAEQTGLGQSFGGFALVAISTSLPEFSTVVASIRLRRYVMAVSNIFGTNLFNIGLIVIVDAAYRGGPS